MAQKTRTSSAARVPREGELPAPIVAAILRVEGEAQQKFAAKLVDALAKISPALAPRLSTHPLADQIREGRPALKALVKAYPKATHEMDKAAILDAMAEIFVGEGPTSEAVKLAERALSEAKSPTIATLAAKALARAKHEPFLEEQRRYLASNLPEQQRIAARLLGFGRYQPAVPELLALISTDDMAVADVVIGALGEIGSDEALPKLHRLLGSFIRTEDVIDALGNIGQSVSAVRLLPFMTAGSTSQREKATLAIGRIARRNKGWIEPPEIADAVRETLERSFKEDPSALCRFYALVAASILGVKLTPTAIAKAVGATLSPDEMTSLQGFLAARPQAGTTPKSKARKLL